MKPQGRDFRIARAKREGNNHAVTPQDMLSLALESATNGTTKPDQVLILYREPMEDGGWVYRYYAAGLDRPEELAMLEWRRLKLFQEWQKD